MDLSIVTTGHDVADARLHRLLAAAARAGLRTEIIGLGDATGAPDGARVRTRPRTGMLHRLVRAVVWPWRARGAVVLTCDPDTTPAAWLACRVRRRRWVADVHEDYAALLADRAWVPAPLRAVLMRVTRLLIGWTARADLTLVADEHVPPRRAKRRLVVRNEPDLAMLPDLAPLTAASARDADAGGTGSGAGGDAASRYRAIYIGDLRTSRGLRTMVEAVAATQADARPWELDLVGPLGGDDLVWFTERTRATDAGLIRWHDRQPPAQAWQIAAGADLGLCLLADTPAFRDALPSKIYEYLGTGLPVLSTPLPRVVSVLRPELSEDATGQPDDAPGPGEIVADAEQATAALRRFANDQPWRAGLRRAARQRGLAQRSRPNVYDQVMHELVALLG